MKRTMLRLSCLLCALMLLVLVCPSEASVLRSGDRVSIGEGTTINDELYAFAQSVVVGGTIADDASIFASEIRIAESGSIAGSANIAGSNVEVGGTIGDNLRLAGSDVTVSGRIGGNAAIAGAELLVAGAGSIGRDLYAAGSVVDVQGRVGRNLRIASDRATVNAPVGGTVRIDANRVTIGSQAVIQGDLIYTSPQAAVIEPGAQITGQTIHRRQAERPDFLRPLAWFLRFIGFLGLLLVGFIVLALAPKTVYDSAETIFRSPWISLLIGFVLLVLVPGIVLVLVLTIIGVPLALILLAMYLILIYISRIVVATAIGNWIFARSGRADVSRYLAFFVGLFVYAVLTWLPFIGGFFSFAALLLGLGALAWTRYTFLRDMRAEGRI